MLLECHWIKNFPPTNLNRDDNGSPKTCVFGGVNRGRISSQCVKRSWRSAALFQQAVSEENLDVLKGAKSELARAIFINQKGE